jgi:fibronectin type 3 domain-containing protein
MHNCLSFQGQRLYVKVIGFLFLLLLPEFSPAASVTVSWQPNTESDLGGYQVYYGTSSNFYSTFRDVGKATQWVVDGLGAGSTYYFAVTAYDLNGNESAYSQEVMYRVEDYTPPTLASAVCEQGDRVKLVFSEPVEQTSAQLITNYGISKGVTVLCAALQPDNKTVYLTTTQQPNNWYVLTVNNVRDRAGVPNTIAAGSTIEYVWEGGDQIKPTVTGVELVRRDYLAVTFSEPLNQSSALTLTNYSIVPSITITAAAIDNSLNKVFLTTSNHTSGQSYTLTINNVKDVSANANTIAANTQIPYACTSGDAQAPVPIRATLVSTTQLQVEFNEVLDATTAVNTANYTISPSVAVTAASLNAAKTLVTLTTGAHAAGTYTVTVRNVGDAVTPPNLLSSAQLSYTYTPPDNTPPTITSAALMSNDLLQIGFSEPVETGSAETGTNYVITPSVQIITVSLDVDQQTALLQTAPHAAGTYTVRVSNIRDISTAHNVILANSSRTYTYAPQDASPPVLKSVALFGNNLVDLTFDESLDRATAENTLNYQVDRGITVTGAQLVGESLNHVYLTTSAHTAGLTYTVSISGLRDRATVPNTIAATIRSTYTYSLADNTPPRLLSAVLMGGNQFLVLTFSEPLELNAAQSKTNYAISNGIVIESATLDASGTTVFLKTTAHSTSSGYTVTVNGVKDLAVPANLIGTENQKTYSSSAQDALAPQLVSADLHGDKLLELAFNEPLDPVSALARSNYTISGNVTVNKVTLSTTQREAFLETSSHGRGTYTVTVKGIKDMASPANTLAQGQCSYFYFPADTARPVLMITQLVNERMIDLTFSEPLDRTTAENKANYAVSGGVVVERATLNSDMTKVSLITSVQVPGTYTVTVTGVKDASTVGNAILAGTAAQYSYATLDRTPPVLVEAVPHSATMLVVSFSETLNKETAQNAANYKINNSVLVKNAFLSSAQNASTGNQVILETSPHAAGEYLLTVNGVQDASPQRNAVAAYSQVAYRWSPVDTTGPSLIDAKLNLDNMLVLTFDEAVDAVESKKTGNYTIAPPVQVLTAVLDESLNKVWLYTANHDKGTYTVTVSKVKDRAFTPNTIGSHNRIQYACLPADTVPPVLISVNPKTPMSLTVVFDEQVTRESAEIAANYTIEPGIEVKQASLLASYNVVNLETSSHQARTLYTLKVRGIKDRTPVSNEIKKTQSLTYSYTPPDTSPPVLLDGKLLGASLLQLVFSEPLEQSTAENRDNYRIDPSVEILNASLDTSSLRSVYLETTMHMPGVGYGVNVRNLRDRATIPNKISSSTWWSYQWSFTGTSANDNTAPALARVDLVSSTKIDLVFTEPLDRLSAETVSNYAIDDSITVTGATLDTGLVKVHLSTSEHRLGRCYRIRVRNVLDRAVKPNRLSASPAVQYLLTGGLSISNPSQSDYTLALFKTGTKGYVDREYTVSATPDYLDGAAMVRTANDDKAEAGEAFLSFELKGSATVYVAFDKKIETLPSWLSGWKPTGDQVVDSRSNAFVLYGKGSAGGRFTLGGNKGGLDDNMYLVFVVPRLINGMLLSKISRASYTAMQVGVGDGYYVDRDYTVTAMPDSADDLLWIKTANDDKMNRDADFLGLTTTVKSLVTVAYDSRIASLPKWLIDWKAADGQVVDSRGAKFDLYQKSFEAGDVILGGNCGTADDNMYVVMLKPLEPLGGDDGFSTVPGYFTLSQNYPNPFNPRTTIQYTVQKAGRMKLSVFNMLGQTVRVLVDRNFASGATDIVVWDGKDQNGIPVSSGVYFYRIEQERYAKTRRMLLLK